MYRQGPSLGARTVDRDGLERRVDRGWKYSLIERLQIRVIGKLAQVPGDPDTILGHRGRHIPRYIIQLLQAIDGNNIRAVPAESRVGECAIGIISHGRRGGRGAGYIYSYIYVEVEDVDK